MGTPHSPPPKEKMVWLSLNFSSIQCRLHCDFLFSYDVSFFDRKKLSKYKSEFSVLFGKCEKKKWDEWARGIPPTKEEDEENGCPKCVCVSLSRNYYSIVDALDSSICQVPVAQCLSCGIASSKRAKLSLQQSGVVVVKGLFDFCQVRTTALWTQGPVLPSIKAGHR